MSDGFLQFLGIAWRARALIAGEYPCLQALRAGRGKLLIVAADASENTAGRLLATADHHAVASYVAYSKDELGHALGQSQRAALLVVKPEIADKLQRLAQSDSRQHTASGGRSESLVCGRGKSRSDSLESPE